MSNTVPATDKQIAFALRLLAERSLVEFDGAPFDAEAVTTVLTEGTRTPSKGRMSALIEALLAAPRKADRTATQVQASASPVVGLDLSGLPSGTYGVPGGDTRLKVEIKNVSKGKWAGWVFVSDGAVYGEGTRYGRQAPGATYQGRIEDQLRAILSDPQEATAAYGRLTGTCGLCHRPLEDEESVARGVGPICARKFG
jgi:hypothetical protein